MLDLRAFRNIHIDEKVLICGLGSSLLRIYPKHFKNYPLTIGVNDIGAYFDPMYLVISDKLDRENSLYTRYQKQAVDTIANHGSPYVFLRQEMEWIPGEHVIYQNLPYRGSNLDEAIGRHMLIGLNLTIWSALSLSVYMGFSRIGLLGVDFKGQRAVNSIDTFEASDMAIDIENAILSKLKQEIVSNGIVVWNLSDDSKITAFPFIDPQSFEDLK